MARRRRQSRSKPDRGKLAETRFFLRAGHQRLDDAEFLLKGARNTAAVYLAGYAIESALKALLLSVTARTQILNVVASFRGNLAHNFDWLTDQYFAVPGAARFSVEVSRSLRRVNSWSTDLRYDPGRIPPRDAATFLSEARFIVDAIQERL